MTQARIAIAIAAAALLSGCATVATPTTSATQSQAMDQIKRTGSNIPIRERASGPELMRMTDAQRDRQATNNIVAPSIPMRAE